MDNLTLKVIARIYTDFGEKFGVPRQSGLVPELTGKIIFEPYHQSALVLCHRLGQNAAYSRLLSKTPSEHLSHHLLRQTYTPHCSDYR